MSCTGLGRAALPCYTVLKLAIGCIPFIKWEKMVVERSTSKVTSSLRLDISFVWQLKVQKVESATSRQQLTYVRSVNAIKRS